MATRGLTFRSEWRRDRCYLFLGAGRWKCLGTDCERGTVGVLLPQAFEHPPRRGLIVRQPREPGTSISIATCGREISLKKNHERHVRPANSGGGGYGDPPARHMHRLQERQDQEQGLVLHLDHVPGAAPLRHHSWHHRLLLLLPGTQVHPLRLHALVRPSRLSSPLHSQSQSQFRKAFHVDVSPSRLERSRSLGQAGSESHGG